MCRIAAYVGPSIPLENIIVRPAHSLLQQSQNATEAKLAVNGDGFGIGWYDDVGGLGVYRDVLPAWADDNLVNICRMVRSRLFIAHIRASTVGETSRANCHPFTCGNWSFCHNGQVPHFSAIRRRLMAALPDHLFEKTRGTTDSELVFLTLLANGLEQDLTLALTKTVVQLIEGFENSTTKLTCVFSNGQTLFGFRHATRGPAPTLYVSDALDHGGRSVASEPLSDANLRWSGIPENTLCAVERSGVSFTPLRDEVAA